ncbi:MAG: glycerol-3-phosphate dehydrogenase [Sphingomonadales bacterium]|jgi:glycerol-3-phosphate dehydrogenase|nr:glycerol-3-phosphate dehydrogenase [Sphingomonadales bacterium]
MDSFDLLIVGGGINGAAIARDAAGRGLDVLLVEKDDLASHTSAASSKLIHGGLRYLEQYEFKLVRESLHEREILLATAPHIVRPLRFVLPDPPGGRPWWMIRLGLLLYDLLARRGVLPRSRGLGKGDNEFRAPLKPGGFRLGTYWDAWVDDARLVVLNALDAHERGAEIATRTELVSARRDGEAWTALLSGGRTVAAKMIVNAAGPWVAETLNRRLETEAESKVRLIKGSHILVPRLWEGDHAYILQQGDGRVVFALPYGARSLIGTTDVPVASPEEAVVTPEEIAYLCAATNGYFRKEIVPADVIWSYSGVRALYDDGAQDAKDVTRDYRLELDNAPGPKLLSVFGGKITTARALALEALDILGVKGFKFTASSTLPGGTIDAAFNAALVALARWLPEPLVRRLALAYGTRLARLLDGATSIEDLGRHFGAGLYEREVRYLCGVEFARTAEDIIWRRTKLGLEMTAQQRKALATWLR